MSEGEEAARRGERGGYVLLVFGVVGLALSFVVAFSPRSSSLPEEIYVDPAQVRSVAGDDGVVELEVPSEDGPVHVRGYFTEGAPEGSEPVPVRVQGLGNPSGDRWFLFAASGALVGVGLFLVWRRRITARLA